MELEGPAAEAFMKASAAAAAARVQRGSAGQGTRAIATCCWLAGTGAGPIGCPLATVSSRVGSLDHGGGIQAPVPGRFASFSGLSRKTAGSPRRAHHPTLGADSTVVVAANILVSIIAGLYSRLRDWNPRLEDICS